MKKYLFADSLKNHDEQNRGLLCFELDSATGALTYRMTCDRDMPFPPYFIISKDQETLYCVSRNSASLDGQPQSAVSSFHINWEKNLLEFKNGAAVAGQGACHLCLNEDETMLFVATFGTGTVFAFPVENGVIGQESSRLEPIAVKKFLSPEHYAADDRQARSHFVQYVPELKRLFYCDHGLDCVEICRLDENKKLVLDDVISFPKGSSPRHLVFDQALDYCYVLAEKSSELYAVELGEKYKIVDGISMLPADFEGSTKAAAIKLGGGYIMGSNRGHDSIFFAKFDKTSKKLSGHGWASSLGQVPRDFELTADGKFMVIANQDSDDLQMFSVDGNKLTKLNEAALGGCVCVKIIER